MTDGFGGSGWGGNLVSGGGGGGPSNPLITNLLPVDGTEITPGTHISFDVTSDVDIVLISVSVLYLQTGASESIWDGDAFAPNFVTGSARTPIANGFHYDVVRRGGWPLSPTIVANMADANGNAAEL
jgi:hypothetical protein